MKILNQTNAYLTYLGTTLAGLIVSLLAVVLMLFPGIVFSYLFIKVIWLLMGSKTSISLNEVALLTVLSIASWYIGIGISRITKKSKGIDKQV